MRHAMGILLSYIVTFYMFSNSRLRDVTNSVFFVSCLCFGLLIGSFVSVFVVSGAIFGLGHILFCNVPFPRSTQVKLTSMAFSSYFLAELFSSIINPGQGNLNQIIENIPFLAIIPLFALVFIERGTLLLHVQKGAAVASISGYVFILCSEQIGIGRAELLAGNPGVLALLSSVLLAINCVSATQSPRGVFWIFFLGVIASIGLITSTGMRGMLPSIFLVPVVVILALKTKIPPLQSFRLIAFTSIGVLVVAALSFEQIERRVRLTLSEISSIQSGNYDSSLGERLLLWQTGYELFLKSPWTGQGPGNAQDLMPIETKALSGISLSYSHYHNAVINQLARSGIIGLSSLLAIFIVPFLICIRQRKDEIGHLGFAILCGVQSSYFFAGFTGLMVGHDILDAVYIVAIVFSIYVIPRSYSDF